VTPAFETNQWGQVMPKFEFRFDIATILLASVLTVIGISAGEAARKGGGNAGEFRSDPAAASSQQAPASTGQHAPAEQQTAPEGEFTPIGGALGGVVNRFGR
jgi:hypothetical protein